MLSPSLIERERTSLRVDSELLYKNLSKTKGMEACERRKQDTSIYYTEEVQTLEQLWRSQRIKRQRRWI